MGVRGYYLIYRLKKACYSKMIREAPFSRVAGREHPRPASRFLGGEFHDRF